MAAITTTYQPMKKQQSQESETRHSALGAVMGWRFFTKHNDENLRAMPKDRDVEILFDDGTVLKYSDDNWPFAEVIAWREIACP